MRAIEGVAARGLRAAPLQSPFLTPVSVFAGSTGAGADQALLAVQLAVAALGESRAQQPYADIYAQAGADAWCIEVALSGARLMLAVEPDRIELITESGAGRTTHTATRTSSWCWSSDKSPPSECQSWFGPVFRLRAKESALASPTPIGPKPGLREDGQGLSGVILAYLSDRLAALPHLEQHLSEVFAQPISLFVYYPWPHEHASAQLGYRWGPRAEILRRPPLGLLRVTAILVALLDAGRPNILLVDDIDLGLSSEESKRLGVLVRRIANQLAVQVIATISLAPEEVLKAFGTSYILPLPDSK